ncbi:Bromo adjacent y domain-containing 1 protein [Clonorchis sinensis]|uniref:Bromo adjacent y domain-containing 1 protein n=1 Tax=Clonorchis sinensis TaxID=79923 RepID=A0A3R7CQ14_CLOSI|nr:Bromo adjacent y domain-containing 1 protein [Clonorchis sinensis]
MHISGGRRCQIWQEALSLRVGLDCGVFSGLLSMKTRLTARYRTEIKVKKSEENKSRGVQPLRRRRKVPKAAGSRHPKVCPSYKDVHAVGKRQSSQFVTYTQDGRLFYDLYASSQPSRGSSKTAAVVSTVQKRSAVYPSSPDSKAASKKKKGGHRSVLETPSKIRYHRRRSSRPRNINDFKTAERRPSRRSSLKSAKVMTRNANPRKHTVKRVSKLSEKEKVERKLKRELGIEAVTPSLTPGKRLASLNAVALISAVTVSDSSRRIRKNDSLVDRRQSIETIPCQEVAIMESEVSDDATTEPMSVFPTETPAPSDNSQVRFSVIRTVRRKKRPNAVRPPENHTPTVVLCSTRSSTAENPSIASYHSEQFIPLGGSKYGFQQITRQVIHVNAPDKTFDSPGPAHLPVDLPHPTQIQPHPFVTSLIPAPLGSLTVSCSSTSNASSIHPELFSHNGLVNQAGACWQPASTACLSTANLLHPSIPYYPAALFLPSIIPLTHQPASYSPVFTPGPQLSYAFLPTTLNGLSTISPGTGALSLIHPLSIGDGGIPTGATQYSLIGLNGATPQLYPLTWNPPMPCSPQPLSESSMPSPILRSSGHLLGGNPTFIPISSHPTSDLFAQSTSTLESDLPAREGSCQNNEAVESHGAVTQTILTSVNNACVTSTEGVSSLPKSSSFAHKPQDAPRNSINSSKKSKDLEIPSSHDATTPDSSAVDANVHPTSPNVNAEVGAWEWDGVPYRKRVFRRSDCSPTWHRCYRAIRHVRDGILIRERDSVLLCSGPDRCSPPHVARITALFPDPKTGIKMMALLWYYRPEHVSGTAPNHPVPNELYASRHCDTNPVDCIEDKAYVLTASAFSRYMARAKYRQSAHPRPPLSQIVPQLTHSANQTAGLSDDAIEHAAAHDEHIPDSVSPSNVFLCRSVYDYRLRRVCRNLHFHSPIHNHFLGQSSHRWKPRDNPIEAVPSLIPEPPLSLREHPSTSAVTPPPILTPPHETRIRSPSPTSPSSPALRICVPDSPEPPINNTDSDDSTQPCQQLEPTKPTSVFTSPPMSRVLTSISPVGSRSCVITPPPLTLIEQQSTPVRNAITTLHSDTTTNNVSAVPTKSVQFTVAQPTSLPVPVDFVLQKPAVQHMGPNMGLSMGRNPRFVIAPLTTASSSLVPPPVPWPPVCDSSVLETSADLSVNWAEHGEQIALSLDCREKNIPNITPVTCQHTVPSHPTGTQSAVDRYVRTDQFPSPIVSNVQYILPTTSQTSQETESPRLILL